LPLGISASCGGDDDDDESEKVFKKQIEKCKKK